jgi:thiol:disulfide interchange protein DsbD
MGLTFVIVSFSCTGPVVGTLLVEAATQGTLLSPAIGMLGFSLAMAIPFTLFAIFPTIMKSLPKSGGWMNSVKVVLGFIVVAFSLKYLSNADTVTGWHILDREVFLAIWITLFTLMGLYLMGKIKFAHDSEVKHIGIFRLFLIIITFSFVFYLLPGLWGAPLKAVSSFLPSVTTQDFDMTKGVISETITIDTQIFEESKVKAGPYGLVKYIDYETGFEAAKTENKPVLLYFTGNACSNCKKMEANVWSDPNVTNLLKQYIIIALYTDEGKKLAENEQYISEQTGKKIKTIGAKWTDWQIKRYKNNSQPVYAVLNHNEENMIEAQGYNTDIEAYTNWRKAGLEIFNQTN